MPRLVAVAGLPGSGKSRLLQSKEFSGPLSNFIVIDDMGYDQRWLDSFPERVQWNEDAWAKTVTLARVALGLGFHVVLADVEFCMPKRRKWLADVFPSRRIEWIYFANDPETCKHNVRILGPDKIPFAKISEIDKYTTTYVPEGTSLLKVVQIPSLLANIERVRSDTHDNIPNSYQGVSHKVFSELMTKLTILKTLKAFVRNKIERDL